MIDASVSGDYTVLGIAIVVGSIISLGYYLRVLAEMWLGRVDVELPTVPARRARPVGGWSPEAEARAQPEVLFVAVLCAVAIVALFVAMSGVAYASVSNNSVRSRHIVNDAVTSADIKGGGGRTGDIKNRDVNALLAVAKGFATIDARNTNGPATVHNFGGQQTATSPPGVSAERVAQGVYDVTFRANTGTGKFVNVNSVNDLATQVAGRAMFAAIALFVFVAVSARGDVRGAFASIGRAAAS